MKEKSIEINIHDSVALGDRSGRRVKPVDNNNKIDISKRPAGIVEVYEVDHEKGTKRLIRKNNLVVYLGREWVAQRLFAKNNPTFSDETSYGNYTEYVRWAGIGSGGCSIDDLAPDSPTNQDTAMANEVPFATDNTSYCDYRVGDEGLGYYKKPIPTDDITFEQDEANNDKWLVVKIVFSITEDDANGFNINEAGLFTAESNSGPYWHMFARVTFPTIAKTTGRDLLFVWYIYC